MIREAQVSLMDFVEKPDGWSTLDEFGAFADAVRCGDGYWSELMNRDEGWVAMFDDTTGRMMKARSP